MQFIKEGEIYKIVRITGHRTTSLGLVFQKRKYL